MAQSPRRLDKVFAQYNVEVRDIATSLGLCTESVRIWRRGQRPMPPEYAIKIHKRFGIPKHLLRPDLWEPVTKASRPSRPERIGTTA